MFRETLLNGCFNFLRYDQSVANQWKKTGESDPEEEGATDDLDI